MSAQTPMDLEFRFERFFLGPTRGHGTFFDRFGRERRHFTVEMLGRWDGAVFVLEEEFLFDDGKRRRREWRIVPLADGRYEATAEDVVGTAQGRIEGTVARWRYRLKLPVGKRVWTLDFRDWLMLKTPRLVLNIAEARKWGIRVGQMAVLFERPTDQP